MTGLQVCVKVCCHCNIYLGRLLAVGHNWGGHQAPSGRAWRWWLYCWFCPQSKHCPSTYVPTCYLQLQLPCSLLNHLCQMYSSQFNACINARETAFNVQPWVKMFSHGSKYSLHLMRVPLQANHIYHVVMSIQNAKSACCSSP